MKCIFYGRESLKYVYFQSHWMNNRFYDYTPELFPKPEKLEKLIETLEKYRDGELIYEDEYIEERLGNITVATKKILEIERDNFLEIGDDITISGDKGKIKSKKYDVDNNVMYYYTDIFVGVDESQYEKTRKKCAENMIDLINNHLPRFRKWEMMDLEADKATEEQEETFIGKIIKWFKG